MTLDDLFKSASQMHAPAQTNVTVQVGVTTNQTGGLTGESNVSSATRGTLIYVPESSHVGKGSISVTPAQFSGVTTGTNSKGTAVSWMVMLKVNQGRPGYAISVTDPGWNTAFTAEVDSASEIIYGAGLSGATAQLVTISLCHLSAVQTSG